MKKQLLFLSLAAAVLLAGCAKNEIDGGGQTASATHISAKARGAANVTVDTKAPVGGTSLNGQTAEVFASTYDISGYTGSLTATFSNVYARGTMTFDDNNYVTYNTADFGGKDGGNSLLPTDGTMLYLYGFYPKGWDRTVWTPGGPGTECEKMSYTFDGKTDVMSTWLTAADNVKVKYNDAVNAPDKADFTFKHLLTRYHIQMKADDADAITVWGHVKSIQIKEANPAKPVNQVLYDKSTTSDPMSFGYLAHETNTTPVAFFKLSGALSTPTYSDDEFEQAAFADMLALTTTYQNACYSMVAPAAVDATAAAEVTLVVKTVTAAGKETTVEVPVTLDQTKFTANANSTRGFSITLALNFRVGVIQATAIAEEWKDYGIQYEDVDVPEVKTVIGDVKNGGIVYWIDANDNKSYKVFSLKQPVSELSPSPAHYFMRDAGTTNGETDGRKNIAQMKKYSETNINGTKNFAADYPAANYCDTYGTDPAGSWYLPSITELEELSNVYTSNKTLIDGVIVAGTGDAITLTAGSKYLSCSSYRDSSAPLYVVDFANNTKATFDHPLTGMVRCIRRSKAAVAVAVGDMLDGEIVCEVTDNTNYKLIAQNSGNEERAWSEVESYVIGVGAQSKTDGRANSDAIKAYYDTEKAAGRITSDFATAFPAAAYCYSFTGSRGTDAPDTWYLPAAEELQAAYFAVKDKGVGFSQRMPSSTESSTTPANYWVVSPIMFGDITEYPKTTTSNISVRCLRKNTTSGTPSTPPKIGEMKDGGIVYEVNGSKVKVLSLDEGTNLKWAAQSTYVIDAAGQSDTDGKANVAAIKAYFAANTATVGSDFSVAFPAANFCESKNTGGVTGWYLPAKNELVALYNAYKNNKTAINAGIANNSGTAISLSSDFWSSTEYSSNTSNAWFVTFSVGYPSYTGKGYNYYVRCVREL